jgi:hypothetical protein
LPDFEQWTSFYRDLASDFGFCRGRHINHGEIHERVHACFHPSTLTQLNLYTDSATETGWLKGIFRKHRKAFSYLEHAIIWQSFIAELEPEDVTGLEIGEVYTLKQHPVIRSKISYLATLTDNLSSENGFVTTEEGLSFFAEEERKRKEEADRIFQEAEKKRQEDATRKHMN